MSAVFATAAIPLAQEFDMVVTVVSLRVRAAIQSESTVGSTSVEVEYVSDVQHAHRLGDGNVQDLFFDNFSVLERHACDRLAVLGAQQKAPFRVRRHANPRTVLVPVG